MKGKNKIKPNYQKLKSQKINSIFSESRVDNIFLNLKQLINHNKDHLQVSNIEFDTKDLKALQTKLKIGVKIQSHKKSPILI